MTYRVMIGSETVFQITFSFLQAIKTKELSIHLCDDSLGTVEIVRLDSQAQSKDAVDINVLRAVKMTEQKYLGLLWGYIVGQRKDSVPELEQKGIHLSQESSMVMGYEGVVLGWVRQNTSCVWDKHCRRSAARRKAIEISSISSFWKTCSLEVELNKSNRIKRE